MWDIMIYFGVPLSLLLGFLAAWFIRKHKYQKTAGILPEEADKLRSDLETARAQINDLSIAKATSDEKTANALANIEKAASELHALRQRFEESQAQLAKSITTVQHLEEKVTDAKSLRDRLETSQQELTKSQAENRALQEKLATQKTEIEAIQKKFTAEFENLANRILEDKSKKFTEQNKTNIDQILKPLSEKLGEFRTKVEETYDKESKERFTLKAEIDKLVQANQQITKEAGNLTNALKGESKTQGNWGEMILETILEKSGLIKGTHFVVQQSTTTTEGRRLQPDVIVHLPDSKNVVVDAKVSLTAYERYFSCEDHDGRQTCLCDHLSSIRGHIKELSAKNYQSLYSINSPDFVLMFLPVEPAFGLAILQEPGLFQEAFEKNIVIVAPSTLLATLRIIGTIWRQEYQNRNAVKIATEAGRLYDKFVTFVEDLEEIGKKIEDSKKAFEKAHNKLASGTGNLIKRAEDMRKLGAKTSKSLAPELLEISSDANEQGAA